MRLLVGQSRRGVVQLVRPVCQLSIQLVGQSETIDMTVVFVKSVIHFRISERIFPNKNSLTTKAHKRVS